MKKSFKELLKGYLKPATSKEKQKEEEKAKEIEVAENVEEEEEEIIDITEEDKNLVWAFNAGQAGNDFRGNPKYLFVYVNKYRKDITAYWLSGSEETTEYVRNLGYRAYTLDTLEADLAIEKTGVLVAEQVKIGIPKGMRHIKYLNLYHGVGAKDVERVLTTGGMAEGLAHKYILHNQYYRNNQLFLCPSPMMVDDFKRMCGVDEDKVVKAGYPRNIYQKYFEPITTFDHDILKAKGLDESYKIAVYAPTYRQALSEDTFHIAIPDIEKLIEVCKRQKLLFVFKMHPVMENEYAYLKMKEKYEDCPYLLFWDNRDDIYEIIDKIDLAVIDYSSIFTDFVSAGVPHYIRYVFDYDEAVQGLNHDYMEVTTGELCYSFSELLQAIETYKDRDDLKGIDRISNLYWKYSDKDSFEKIVNQTLEFTPVEREFPTLYSFDIFDTLISRKVLDPRGIFYKVKEVIKKSDLNYPEYFVEEYPKLRMFAEADVRECYHKTMESRHSERREIYMKDIFDKLQWVYNLTDEQAAFLMKCEQEIEIGNTIPLTENINKVKKLLENKETVVLISDMYLPKEIIEKMLEKADPVLAQIPLFLSSEYGVQKTTRKLFLEVYKSFKPFYDFGKWIHTGDGRVPDVNMPRRLGIVANQIEKPEYNEFEGKLTEQLDSYDSYLVAALMARFRQNHLFDKEKFVYSYVSLCFVPYIDWLLKDAKARGYETLYFVSRDGYHLKRIADEIIKMKNIDIKTKYIYASRRAWRIPSFVHDIDEGFWFSYGNFAGVTTYDKLLQAMSLSEEKFMELFPKLSYLKEEKEIEPNEKNRLVEIFKNSAEYKEYLLNLAKEQRVSVCGYLEQEIDKTEKFAMVEYWGRGYTQENFTSLWKTIAGDDAKSYFYYSRTILASDEDNIRYNFTTDNASQLFIEAIFANMPYKSIESYKLVNGKYEPVINNISYDKELFNAMEKYLLEFTRNYEALDVTDREKLDRGLYNFILDYYKTYQEDEMFIKVLAPLVDSVALYGQKKEFAPAFTAEDLEKMKEKVPRGKFTRNIRISVARSFKPVQDEYRKMYQLKETDTQGGGYLIPEKTMQRNEEFEQKIQKLTVDQIEKQKIYNVLVSENPVENKILFMADGKKISYTGFYTLGKLLEAQDTFAVKEVKAKEYTNKEDLLKEIATARFIICLKPLVYLAMMTLREETEVIVLGESAFPFIHGRRTTIRMAKKPLEYKEMIQKRMHIDHFPIPSLELMPVMSEMYGIGEKKAFEMKGSCQTDIYFNEEFIRESKEKVVALFPEAQDKKVILYMPLLRNRTAASGYKELLNLERLKKLIGDKFVVVCNIPLPKGQYIQNIEIEGFSKNITKDISLREAVGAADIVVGDYRDTMFEAALMRKPIFMTNYDADKVLKDKELVCAMEEVQVGPMVDSEEKLVEHLSKLDEYDYSKQKAFCKKYFTYCDGKSAERIAQYIESAK